MDTVFAINLPKITLAPDELFKIGPITITNSNLTMIIVMVLLVIRPGVIRTLWRESAT